MAFSSFGAEAGVGVATSTRELRVERAAWRFSLRRKLAPNIDDGAAMQQPVQCGGSHDGVTGKDLGPVAESFIRGEDDGAVVVVALGDHLKEETGLRLVQLQ